MARLEIVRPPGGSPTVRFYGRKSLGEDRQEQSLNTQRSKSGEVARLRQLPWDTRVEYIDEDRSRDDFAGHADWHRLMVDLQPKDVVITYERSRIGADLEYSLALRDVGLRGARLVVAATNEEPRWSGGVAGLVEVIHGMTAQEEINKLRKRTRDALRERVHQGYVSGAPCFGLRHVRDPQTKMVRAVIDEARAGLVRRIFRAYDAGDGPKRIAFALNAEGIPAPRAPLWSSAAVFKILRNARYRGVYVHGRTTKERRGGKTINHRSDDTITVEHPEWQIVDDLLWTRVQARIAAQESEGPQGNARAGKYALIGVAFCATCKGTVSTASNGQSPSPFYTCTRRRRLGPSACSAHFYRPVPRVEQLVRQFVEENVLSPQVIADIARVASEKARRRLSRPTAHLGQLQAQLDRLAREQRRLVQLAAAGDEAIPEVAARLRRNREEMRRLEGALAEAQSGDDTDAKCALVERLVRAKLERLGEAIRGDAAHARIAYRQLFPDGLHFVEDDGGTLKLVGEACLTADISPSGDVAVVQSSRLRGKVRRSDPLPDGRRMVMSVPLPAYA